MNAALRSLIVVLPVLALIACENTKPPLPGERLSVLTLDKQLEPDPEIALLEIRLPRTVVNSDWPDAGGYPNHVMQHVALGEDLSTAWTPIQRLAPMTANPASRSGRPASSPRTPATPSAAASLLPKTASSSPPAMLKLSRSTPRRARKSGARAS